MFFLHGRTPHKVLGCGPALTLYIRGVDKPYETIARAESEKPDWEGVNQPEVSLESEAARVLMTQVAISMVGKYLLGKRHGEHICQTVIRLLSGLFRLFRLSISMLQKNSEGTKFG